MFEFLFLFLCKKIARVVFFVQGFFIEVKGGGGISVSVRAIGQRRWSWRVMKVFDRINGQGLGSQKGRLY